MRFINQSDPGLERYIQSRSVLLYGWVQFVIEQWDTTCSLLYGLVWLFIAFDCICACAFFYYAVTYNYVLWTEGVSEINY